FRTHTMVFGNWCCAVGCTNSASTTAACRFIAFLVTAPCASDGSKLYGAISGPRRAQLDCARNTFTSTVTRPRVFSSWSSALAAATGSSSPMPCLRCLSTRSPDDPPSKEEPLQKGKDQSWCRMRWMLQHLGHLSKKLLLIQPWATTASASLSKPQNHVLLGGTSAVATDSLMPAPSLMGGTAILACAELSRGMAAAGLKSGEKALPQSSVREADRKVGRRQPLAIRR
ncbi:hypothetical protein HPB47_028020, partial [Ixodes persulcatus]